MFPIKSNENDVKTVQTARNYNDSLNVLKQSKTGYDGKTGYNSYGFQVSNESPNGGYITPTSEKDKVDQVGIANRLKISKLSEDAKSKEDLLYAAIYKSQDERLIVANRYMEELKKPDGDPGKILLELQSADNLDASFKKESLKEINKLREQSQKDIAALTKNINDESEAAKSSSAKSAASKKIDDEIAAAQKEETAIKVVNQRLAIDKFNNDKALADAVNKPDPEKAKFNAEQQASLIKSNQIENRNKQEADTFVKNAIYIKKFNDDQDAAYAKSEEDRKAKEDAFNKKQKTDESKINSQTNSINKSNEIQQNIYTINIPSFNKSINVNSISDVNQLKSLIEQLIDAKLSSGM
jgi:hypothetical protein